MRVLMTADPGSHVWPFTLDLVAGLGEQGVEVVLATLGARPCAEQRREARAIPNVMLAESDYKIEWMAEPWEDLVEGGDWLVGLSHRYGVDVVHCNHLAHGHLPWDVPVLTVAHACKLSFMEAVSAGADESDERYAREVSRSLRGATAIVAPSRTMLETLQRLYGPIGDGTVIYSARRAMPHTTARKEPHIFCAPARRHDAAVNTAALGKIAGSVPWPIHVAGRIEPCEDDILPVQNVDVLGPLSARALSAWLRRSAIFVMPARYEPSGLSVLNAARAGCALVLSDIPSLRELWGEAALFVPVDDDSALAATLTMLAGDSQARGSMARAARRRALDYSYERCVREYLLAYRVLRGGYERLYDGVREAPRTDAVSSLSAMN
jgi:glycogen synthase